MESLYISHHWKDLVDRVFGEDLHFCAQVDTTNIVPVFEEGVIRIS